MQTRIVKIATPYPSIEAIADEVGAVAPPALALRRLLNVPYDKKYEDLYLAFIAGLSGFGLIPHATAEISGSERRLDRIVRLIQSDVRRIYDGEIIFAEELMPLRV